MKIKPSELLDLNRKIKEVITDKEMERITC